jgi:riboflavin biosynthesis pyrimidine reductase
VIYPPEVRRFVVTRSGGIPLENRFFTDAPDLAYVLVPEDLPAAAIAKLTASTNVIQIGKGEVDLKAALRMLRQERNIRYLLCEGGANLNAELLQTGLVDELFLTIAPKIKGGAALPTIVEGPGFPPSEALPLTLLSLYRDEDELYLRYRIGKELRTYTRAKSD